MSGLVHLRHCPSSVSTLRVMFTHQGSINKKLASKTVADQTRVYPQMYRTVVRASRNVLLNKVVHQASLPFEFVASRSLSLVLMSRRKVETHFTIGHAHNRCCAEPNTAYSHFEQNGCSAAPTLFATSCAHHSACITPKAALIAGASCGQRRHACSPRPMVPPAAAVAALSLRRCLPTPSTVPDRYLQLPAP